jgi:hypothetical protein
VLVLAFVWPALYNRQPFFYYDTTGYIGGADAAFSRLAHYNTVWTNAHLGAIAPGAVLAPKAARKSLSSVKDKAVLAGRSIYYGVVLYVAHLVGRLWPAVLAQAAVVLLAVALTLQGFGVFTWLRLTIVSFVLITLTPVAFFTSFLMPDVFAAIAILAVSNLLVHGRVMPPVVTAIWVVLLSASLLFHSSHVLIALGMLGCAILLKLFTRFQASLKGIAFVALALIISFAGDAAFNFAVTRLVGAAPIRPPFLMARVIADGPGYRYLVANCPAVRLTACEFVSRLSAVGDDEFLWSKDSAKGVFDVVDVNTRRKLSEEQYRFAWSSLMFDPLSQALASSQNTWTQFRSIGLEEFDYGAYERNFLAASIPEPYLRVLRTTKAWQEAVPKRALSFLVAVVTMFSFIYLACVAFHRRQAFAGTYAILAFAAAVVGGIAINAFVCGALSTPHDRYQARVIWLVPLVAMLLKLRSTERSGKSAQEVVHKA